MVISLVLFSNHPALTLFAGNRKVIQPVKILGKILKLKIAIFSKSN